MKSKFAGFYRPTDNEFAELWKKATFVVDANILLNLYRYPAAIRDELLKVFGQVEDRLWLPYHAALEYQRNRPKVIAEQKRRFHEVRASVDNLLAQLEAEVAKLRRRHSLIDLDPLVRAIRPEVEKYKAHLNKLETEQSNVQDDDALRESIDCLFGNRVGPAPDNEKLASIYKDGQKRYDHGAPPGYSDNNKSESADGLYSYDGRFYNARFGDLILWTQILDFAASKLGSHIIFLTDDEKEDWWWSVKSDGQKKIGPRPELVAEIKDKGQAADFYMYNFEKFLEYSKTYLGSKVSNKSIEAVKETRARLPQARISDRDALDLVRKWLEKKYPGSAYKFSKDNGVDFLRIDPGDREQGTRPLVHGYLIKTLGARSRFDVLYYHIDAASDFAISRPHFCTLTLVIVYPSAEVAIEKSMDLPTALSAQKHPISLIIGYVETNAETSEAEFVDVFHHNVKDLA